MSASKEQSLSSDDLRKRLYQTFKNRGVLDSLKTQLRNQLIQELKLPLARETLSVAATAQAHPVSVLASNSLVIDHLLNSGYEYTLSVFYSECGMSKDKVFSMKDLFQFMKINPQSPLYKCLVSNIQNGQKGLLISLLSELLDHHIHSELRDVGTQTSTAPSSGESLVRKLQMIDEEYEDLRQKGSCWASVEAKLAAYRKEMEEQSRAELNTKLHHFQELEVARVRMEERDRCRQELINLTRSLERTYEQKAEALMSREKNAIERLRRQQEIEEMEIYNQRQALLKEMEAVRNMENELRHQAEAFEKSCKVQDEKMHSIEELLRKREQAVQTMEDTYDQKLNNELRKLQLELEDDYARRTEKLGDDEKRNKEETSRLQTEAAVLNSKAEEFVQTTCELKRVQTALELAQADVGTLLQQNSLLRERLEDMSDHAVLRRERTQLQAHIHLLQEQLQESQQEVQRLHPELSSPPEEVQALQAEVRRLEATHRLDQEELQNQQQVFHVQLTQEVERCGQLKSQLLECEERTRWMSAHTDEIKQQLRATQQALENEVFRNPKPSVVNCSILDLSSDKVVPLYGEGSLPKARLSYDEGMCDPGLAATDHPPPWPHSGFTEPGMGQLVVALARIRELEKEAESLEEAYRTYQQRTSKIAMARIPSEGAPSPTHATAPYTRPVTAAAHSVNFPLNEPAMPSYYMDRELTQASLHYNRTPPRVHSPRRLSSTPASICKTHARAYTDHGAERCPGSSGGDRPVVMFASPSRVVSTIPAAVVEDDVHITPPNSPQMKSTGREHCRLPNLQDVVSTSSQESSPRPEKISIQDLTEPLLDLHCSSEQLRDTPRIAGHAPTPCIQQGRDSPPGSQRGERDSPPGSQRGERDSPPGSQRGERDSPPGSQRGERDSPPGSQRGERDSPPGSQRGERDSPPDIQTERNSPLHFPQGEDTMISSSKTDARKREEYEEDGEKKWWRERRSKEGRRPSEGEEALEHETREFERLRQEMVGQRSLTLTQEAERGGVEAMQEVEGDGGAMMSSGDASGAELLKGSSPWGARKKTGQDPIVSPPLLMDTADPLHKYMMMVMQSRGRDKEQILKKEYSENQSSEPVMLSEEKDDSIVAFSQEDADEEFW